MLRKHMETQKSGMRWRGKCTATNKKTISERQQTLTLPPPPPPPPPTARSRRTRFDYKPFLSVKNAVRRDVVHVVQRCPRRHRPTEGLRTGECHASTLKYTLTRYHHAFRPPKVLIRTGAGVHLVAEVVRRRVISKWLHYNDDTVCHNKRDRSQFCAVEDSCANCKCPLKLDEKGKIEFHTWRRLHCSKRGKEGQPETSE
ncbi:hypothetical protein PRIPAC_95067 [Pristionchus pacificus]|uniref:Uncharacterized protein n=1 Tax=Pristionchus pacificus TaxID=54126 RepID=A0A2A6CIB1_PRIPA|nr:hypothetical protein PRIPAC_95067 [Pristionchus pacificus]|eukprot:PDM77818.1 hypothetical protein PRIPAC_34685 [Pristionchus pacificus]